MATKTKLFERFKTMRPSEYEKYRHGYNCPYCEEPMVERTNSQTGEAFFGCTDFPRCRGTRDIDGNAPDETRELDGHLTFGRRR